MGVLGMSLSLAGELQRMSSYAYSTQIQDIIQSMQTVLFFTQ